MMATPLRLGRIAGRRPPPNSGTQRAMVYHFGDFTLDERTRQLLSDQGERHLSPKAFELLTLLLQNRPRALSKTELQERLWPATFVQETNLAGIVAEIRRALGDSPSHPEFVRTVHRFGYRFVCEVEVDEAVAEPLASGVRRYLIFDHRQMMLMEGPNVIGRASDATIRIDSPGVSRSHARILVRGGEATLEDLGSKNGTLLNGDRIAGPSRLTDGSEIQLGNVRLTFRIAPTAGPTDTVSTGQSRHGRSL